MRIKLLMALMVDGVDRLAGEVVELDAAIAGEWIGQGLAVPAPAAVERAVVEPGRRADGPAQATTPAQAARARARARAGGS